MDKSVNVKSESGIRKSSRFRSLRSAGIKQEEKNIKVEDTEEEAEKDARLPGNQGSDEELDDSDEDNVSVS